MSKHTPSPWVRNRFNVNHGVTGKQIAQTFAPTDGEAIANLDLIAAAPDLLAALELARAILFDTASDDLDTHNAWNQAHEAISKAKGHTT